MSEDLPIEVAITPEDEPSAEMLSSLLTSKSDIASAYRVRNSTYEYISVAHSDVEDKQQSGWAVKKVSKATTRLKRTKRFDVILENRVWCILHKMGYKHLNGEKFKIRFTRDNGTKGSKQIDAFACDEETAIVVECKARQERGKRSLQKDLLETKALQEYIRKSIFDLYGKKEKPKVIWIYATENIIWSSSDVDRANDSSIVILTENELQYFETFLEHVGPAGKYQIIGDFLNGQKIPGMADVCVPAIKGKIGGEEFFSFVITPQSLLKISFINHQAFSKDDGRPAYQRMMTANRLKEVSEFIVDGGYFPTNVLINFTDKLKFEPISNKENTDPNIKFGWLTLPSKYRTAWIIDGQHRLYGYSRLKGKYLEQSLVVLAFNNMEKRKEAELFININSKQKSVPKGLLVSLLPDIKMNSGKPKEALTAVASAIVRSLSLDKSSPFFRRFAMHGLPPDEGQNLTISEAVNGLVRSGLIGKVHNKIRLSGVLCSGTDEKTITRAQAVLSRYFDALSVTSPDRWKAGRQAYISVNPGVRAHIMLIAEIVKYVSAKKGVDFNTVNEETFMEHILTFAQPAFDYIKNASDEKIKDSFSRRFGDAGVTDYFYELCQAVHDMYPDFGSEDFIKRTKIRDDQRIASANLLSIDINDEIMGTLHKVLVSIYGDTKYPSGEYHYWEKGVQSKAIRKSAYDKMQDAAPEDRLPVWAYLDIVDVKSVVEQSSTWPYFEPFFNIPMPGEPKGKKYYTSWLTRYNGVRRVPSHKSPVRSFTEDDLDFLDWVRAEFFSRTGRDADS